MFEPYLKRWSLVSDGAPIATHSSDLLPVLRRGERTMLKIAHEDEERRGPDLMVWWNGDGAARLLARDGDAVLLERASGMRFDPKRLLGERAFDFANIFCNPDFEIATAPGRLSHQATVVADAAHLHRARLLQWVLAYAGLSAAWTIGEGGDVRLALTVAEIAAAEIANSGS